MPILHGVEVTQTYAVEHRQSQRQTKVYINQVARERITVKDDVCTECLSLHGQYHHIGCESEVCPNCDDYLHDCGCLNGD